MPPRRSLADKARFFKLIGQGATNVEACKTIGISKNTGSAWLRGAKDSAGQSLRERKQLLQLKGPIPYEEMSPDAKRAHDDFEFFRRACFGRLSSPWQVDAAQQFVERHKHARATRTKQFINLNCPPGAGKSTELHDIEAWLIVRERAIRMLLGSSTQRLANRYNGRLRRTLERPRAPMVDAAEVAAGRACDPISSMTQLFGRFQPDNHDLWRQEEFIVAQIGDLAVSEKEPTSQAYGLDTEFLGNRVDISVWDDVVTRRLMRTIEAIENQRETWDDEAETRLEPGGTLWLVGQRLGPLDLYAYNKAKLDPAFDDEADDDDPVDGYVEITPEGSKIPRKYHSIVYPAHDESRCHKHHSIKEPRFWSPDDPEACLLDPIRLSWRELRQKMASNNEGYRTVYQQEDVDPGDLLVPRVFVTGGMWEGEQLPGCYDTQRAYHEMPKSLSIETYSVMTVDPSATNWWACEWWLYDDATKYRYLMELVRNKLSADQFLNWNPDAKDDEHHGYSGVLEDMWYLSNRLGRPFKILIIERNGAQRFLGQLDYFRRWCAFRGVSYYPHDTMSNKADENYGVQILRDLYRTGRVRLPNKATHGDMGHMISRQLVDEVTVWPDGLTTDCVMAQWFLEWWIPRIVMPDIAGMPKHKRQSWLRRSA